MKSSKTDYFSDIKTRHCAGGYILDLYGNGITTGYPSETFQPGASTTRAEYSVFLARAMNEDFR
ncbi:S-layer homology domain-containing protein [Planomicrobium stackebrandtii]|uniref:S-layer homology domain-containing protein n=1 Tax=Planomicrobium stackebrandtii TaxID=253160 RepID=UPI00280B0063|nr:S-layer homology domain-containing protein [Planomicrobium stackebrandtii]